MIPTALAVALALVPPAAPVALLQEPASGPPLPAPERLAEVGRLNGLELTDAELELMLGDVARNLASFDALRRVPLANDVGPALRFTPLVEGVALRAVAVEGAPHEAPIRLRPDDPRELCFADLATLSHWVRTRQVSCVELTEVFLALNPASALHVAAS